MNESVPPPTSESTPAEIASERLVRELRGIPFDLPDSRPPSEILLEAIKPLSAIGTEESDLIVRKLRDPRNHRSISTSLVLEAAQLLQNNLNSTKAKASQL